MTENTSSQKPIQRILIILSGLAFFATTSFGMVELFSKGFQEPENKAQTAATAANSQLEAQARGYEMVLQREPENQLALQGLVQVRMQMNDLQGAIAPMEKLVKLNPDNPQYKALLEGIKQRAGTTGTTQEKSDRSQTNRK
ncbi:MAG: tetratricopeptide repeat protein [Cyanobacteriota bacterium]